jgi:hypothetical protein
MGKSSGSTSSYGFLGVRAFRKHPYEEIGMDRRISDEDKAGLDEGWLLRLLPRHRIYLFSPEDRGKRFVRLLRETWRRLPCYARRRILAHWRSGIAHLDSSPMIGLHGDWEGRIGGIGLGGTKAHTCRGGDMLRFWSDIVDAYPDELVRDLIAHELTHVFGYASDWYCDDLDDPIQDEQDADALTEMWGFSSTAIDDWDREHRVGLPDFTKMDAEARARWVEEQHELDLRCGR